MIVISMSSQRNRELTATPLGQLEKNSIYHIVEGTHVKILYLMLFSFPL